MSKQGLELLQYAIQNGSVAAMAPVGEITCERWIVRLLAMEIPHGEPQTITAELRKGKLGPIDGLVESTTPVSVMARVKWAEVSFPTIIISQQRQDVGRRVTLQMPVAEQIEVEQRRRTAARAGAPHRANAGKHRELRPLCHRARPKSPPTFWI